MGSLSISLTLTQHVSTFPISTALNAPKTIPNTFNTNNTTSTSTSTITNKHTNPYPTITTTTYNINRIPKNFLSVE
jgi:hypothetical protein